MDIEVHVSPGESSMLHLYTSVLAILCDFESGNLINIPHENIRKQMRLFMSFIFLCKFLKNNAQSLGMIAFQSGPNKVTRA